MDRNHRGNFYHCILNSSYGQADQRKKTRACPKGNADRVINGPEPLDLLWFFEQRLADHDNEQRVPNAECDDVDTSPQIQKQGMNMATVRNEKIPQKKLSK